MGIKNFIPEFDGKMQSNSFMDWLVCVQNRLAHNPMINGHKITLVAAIFCVYAAI